MKATSLFYILKPFIPRSIQLAMRAAVIRRKLPACTHSWPILERSGHKPRNWLGWPGDHNFALVLTHDVEHYNGQNKSYRVAQLEMNLGFRSSFNLVPRRYEVSAELRNFLVHHGFEVGVHDYNHDGLLFSSYEVFSERKGAINDYLKLWKANGFRAGAMHHNLKWIGELDVLYDCSTFDTDPFEPQPDPVETIFPFLVNKDEENSYVEMPYTLPQDFTLLVLMGHENIEIWKRKLDWIVERGGMALINTHPDYMCFDGSPSIEEYQAERYEEFLQYVIDRYDGMFWHALPCDVARFVKGMLQESQSLTGNYIKTRRSK
ncbi:hypothetical protein QA601_17365 [Chitinispirillales bacterium ANBcel5]|uniref:hypothetical protein n=1 Tax=Cellulosispirillum alkaliphilum TaxID=3039283 RepID=UPI002A5143BA|nr:hypothetical protein [Chitinispirillales bacterium ANBcel5]